MIKKKNTFSNLINNDYISNFYDKLTNVIILVATIGIVPILLIGSIFYFRTGFIVFGVMEILVSVVILIVARINKISKQHKQSVILILLYYTAVFVLLTTGNSGAGIGSILMVIMLFSIVSRKPKNYTLFYVNFITISIITILLYLGVFKNLEIFALRASWPFLYIILNAYSFVFIFVFGNYKNEFQKTQLLLKARIESFNDLIVLSVDHNYCYLYFNKVHMDTMKQLYNVEIEIGKSILDYISDSDDRNSSKKNYDLALLGKYHSTIEDIKGEQQRFNFEASYSPIYDDSEIIGVALFARDITARLRVQQELKDSEEKYRLLTNNMPLGMAHFKIVRDNNKKAINYCFLGVNKVYEEMFGVKNSEIVCKNIWDFYPETEQHWKDAFENVSESGKTYIFEDYVKEFDMALKVYAYKTATENLAITLQDVTEEKKNQEKIRHMSNHDYLTRLHNRRFLFEELNKYWRQCTRESKPISIIMIDIDDFKLYNDSYGHVEGDKALIKIANILDESMARPLDIVGRYGGEEFIVALPYTPLEGAHEVAENIRKKIIELELVHSKKSNSELLTISLGITSLIPNKETTIEKAINEADIALFYAKEKGKNRTEKYTENLELK
jgi:diguanylate cyclase (GGDEF)-like protein/PAS domain S-box-containing protein